MYRTIIHPKQKEELTLQLPESYLNKHIEVIAFQVSEEDYSVKKQKAREAIEFFKTIEVDMSDFKFDRDEANAR